RGGSCRSAPKFWFLRPGVPRRRPRLRGRDPGRCRGHSGPAAPSITRSRKSAGGVCWVCGFVSIAPEAPMFDLERFVADCRAAFAEDPGHKAVREVLARAVSDPSAVLAALGEPERAGIGELFHSDRLTILNVVWSPGMAVMPPTNRWGGVTAFARGGEATFSGGGGGAPPTGSGAAGAGARGERAAEPLGVDIIHSVLNPIDRLTGAIHIYGGDFFAVERSEWDSLTLEEHPSDGERVRRTFEEANARYEASRRLRAE